MKKIIKSVAAASVASMVAFAAPASAQVQGNIATVDLPSTIVGTQAFANGYSQINESYKAQIDQRRTLQTQRQTILGQLDTNDDNEVDEAEMTAAEGTPQKTQLDQIDGQIATLTTQIDGARIYVIEQISAQYAVALQEVIAANQIQILLAPDAVLLAPPEANIALKVAAALDTKVPTAQIIPPQGWAPQRASLGIYQQVQEFLLQAQLFAQAQQQAQAAQSGEQPATEAPVGR